MSIKVLDTLTNKAVFNAKHEKQAKQIVYAFERNDRRTGDYTPNRYIVVLTGYKTDRLNKQARRAFETQEV